MRGVESTGIPQRLFERGVGGIGGEEKNRNFIGDEDEVWTRRPRQDETGFGGVKPTPMKSEDGRKLKRASRIWDGIPSSKQQRQQEQQQQPAKSKRGTGAAPKTEKMMIGGADETDQIGAQGLCKLIEMSQKEYDDAEISNANRYREGKGGEKNGLKR
ncbi:hypothetical protein An11g07440 [Aspergillus niger]|uniref:Uncharacterized protein n=2 Tax=Aspergillus niger TaxID=5061 RepID=A2QX32_ASPNC|nr:hypothetical protein An11g07440 [Aspergillus niger]CAK40788.1 hypothetical protein An11g07440 [Aspergillus niger]